MVKKFSELWKTLDEDVYVGEKLDASIKSLGFVGLAVMFFTIITTVLNIKQETYFMAATTGFFCICGLISAITCFCFHLRMPAVYLLTIGAALSFTYYAIAGSNEGFAILWTMLAPLCVMFFLKVKVGMWMSMYFMVFFIVMFYTPLRSFYTGIYTETFMTRYPIIYMAMTSVSSVIMINYQSNALKDMKYSERLDAEVKALTAQEVARRLQMEKLSIQMVETLANAIDAKDRYTNGHSYRVSEYSVRLARRLGWSEERVNILKYEALLHDVGKIGVPDSVLNKETRLSDIEFAIIQSHTFLGGEILRGTDTIPGAWEAARHHHERVDGRGYPDGLKGEEIPEAVRIICIADSFDAMSSNRVYRKALPREVIRGELVKGKGTQFDEGFVEVFIEMYDNGELELEEEGLSSASAGEGETKTVRDVSDSKAGAADSANSVAGEGETKTVGAESGGAAVNESAAAAEKLQEAIDFFDKNFSDDNQARVNFEDISDLYEYMRNLRRGLDTEYSLVVIKVKSIYQEKELQEKAILAGITAIKKEIKHLHACARCADDRIAFLFTKPADETIKRIMQYVYIAFYKYADGSMVELSYDEIEP